MSLDRMIAITGGIGSGKTYVSGLFEKYGIPVFNTDKCAKVTMNEDVKIIKELRCIFGNDIYKNGNLNREMLGSVFFSDKKKKEQIEALTHPAVWKSFMDWKYYKIYKENYPFVMLESAILTQNKTYKLFDFAVFVYAPNEIRRERIMSREGMTEEKMEMVIGQQEKQMDVYEKLKLSGLEVSYLYNDGEEDVEISVKKCIENYKKRFKR